MLVALHVLTRETGFLVLWLGGGSSMAAIAFVQVFCPGELDGLYEESDEEDREEADLIQLLGSGQLETIKLRGVSPKKTANECYLCSTFCQDSLKKNTHIDEATVLKLSL